MSTSTTTYDKIVCKYIGSSDTIVVHSDHIQLPHISTLPYDSTSLGVLSYNSDGDVYPITYTQLMDPYTICNIVSSEPCILDVADSMFTNTTIVSSTAFVDAVNSALTDIEVSSITIDNTWTIDTDVDDVLYVSNGGTDPLILQNPTATGVGVIIPSLGTNTTTTIPTSIVGTDTTGSLYSLGIGSGLSISGGVISTTGGLPPATIYGSYLYHNSTDWVVGNDRVGIGYNSGRYSQQSDAIAIGTRAGEGTVGSGQGQYSVAIGYEAGRTGQDPNSVAIGYEAGRTTQGNDSIAIGSASGYSMQRSQCIAIGFEAGKTNQQQYAVAIGYQAGTSTQGTSSIAIGNGAGTTSQGIDAVAIGNGAGTTGQKKLSVAIGYKAGATIQGTNAVAIGNEAGNNTQMSRTVAIGDEAGKTNQQQAAVAIGYQAGANGQSTNSIAIGHQAGTSGQSTNSIAMGYNAGRSGQGQYSIAIGNEAGLSSQPASSIIINANVSPLNCSTSGLFIKPIRPLAAGTLKPLYYNVSTGEISYVP